MWPLVSLFPTMQSACQCVRSHSPKGSQLLMKARSICILLPVQGRRKDPTTGAVWGVSTKGVNLLAPLLHPCLCCGSYSPGQASVGHPFFHHPCFMSRCRPISDLWRHQASHTPYTSIPTSSLLTFPGATVPFPQPCRTSSHKVMAPALTERQMLQTVWL